MLDGRREDLSTLRHQLDLPPRLELNHLPKARNTRCVTSLTPPFASTVTSRAPLCLYHSNTGAVWLLNTRNRLRTASGSSSLRRITTPPQLVQMAPGSKSLNGV